MSQDPYQNITQDYEQRQDQSQSQYLQRENEYLKIKIGIKSKQILMLKSQIQKVEEQQSLDNLILNNELTQMKHLHHQFVEASDIQSDLKQYIISLETDLFLTKKELNMFTQKNEEQKAQLINVESRVKKDLEQHYQKQINELGYVCQALSADFIKPNLLEQKSKLQKLYQDILDERFLLEAKNEDLENQLQSYKNTFQTSDHITTLKQVYDNRLQNMKYAVVHWKNRSQQIELIVGEWLKKLNDDNNQMKKDLIKKQSKMLKVFEDLIKQVHQSFNDDKTKCMLHIEELTNQNNQYKSRLRMIDQKSTKRRK